jgi:RNA polymerase sigma-70 factor, ECF subfamily
MDAKEHGRELMLRLREGDETAFADLVKHYERLVLNFAYRHLSDERKAEDITQETFIRIYKARYQWRPEASFRTWLLTIVTRLCLNELRSRKRERRVLRLVSDAPGADFWSAVADRKGASPVDCALANERAELVRRAVAGLSDNQRTALLLHRFDGLSYQEVANVMGLTIEAVRSLLVRARNNVRERLAPILGPERPSSEGAKSHES